jgi:hypothetical protein
MQDPISRVAGVGDTTLFGSQHSMRIWLDPGKLNSYNSRPATSTAAIAAQNVAGRGRQVGALPVGQGPATQCHGQLPDAYCRPPISSAKILLRTGQGSASRLPEATSRGSNSAAKVTHSSRPLQRQARFRARGQTVGRRQRLEHGRPASRRKSPSSSPELPARASGGVSLRHHAVRDGVHREVVKTLFEAIALVFVVMYLFLQSFRATFIPTIAVPVVLLGTFGVSEPLRLLDQHAVDARLVLAIGLLVDDAIVVVESVERIMEEGAFRRATRRSSRWSRSRARWSASRSCCRRSSCPWPFTGAPRASFTGSSR